MGAILAPLSRALFALLLAAWVASASAQGAPQEIPVDYDSVRMTGKLRGTGASFTVYVRCVPFKQAARPISSVEYLGTDGQDPNCVVQSMSLTLNGKPVQFLAKSYADLADVTLPRGVYLTTRGNIVVLHVLGGDGAGAYKARYLIERQRLVAREIEQLNDKGELQVTKQTF